MKLIESIDIQPHTVKWLFDLDKNGLLLVDNSFQRNYVWIKKNQIQLIESILIGYPVPEIYLWNIGTDEHSGDTKYSIIDGQQRSGAIFQYIANNYKLTASSLSNHNSCYDRIKDRFFKDLEANDKKAIWAYVFSVRVVRNNVNREDIVNMFLRLNSNNMTLNPQELRNAEFEGEFMKVTSDLAELPFWVDNSLFGIADRRRMRDISFVSTLLVFIKLGIQEDISNTNINRIYDLYNDEYSSKEEDIERFNKIINEINKVIDGNSERIKILRRQVHLYSLFTVIFDLTMDGKVLTDQQIENYRSFIDNYDNDDLLTKYYPNIIVDIYHYKSLSKVGTREKTNRLERHAALKEVLNYMKP